jgi:hypothetical protein
MIFLHPKTSHTNPQHTMFRVLKWSAHCVGVVGCALFVNYHVSSPPVDIWAIKEKELGKRPTPLIYPDDMKTQWPVKLVNSIGDTAYRLFGVELFKLGSRKNVIFEELKSYLKPSEHEELVKIVSICEEANSTQHGISPCYRLLSSFMILQLLEGRLGVEKEWQKKKEEVEKTTLKQQIIITGISHTDSTYTYIDENNNNRIITYRLYLYTLMKIIITLLPLTDITYTYIH